MKDRSLLAALIVVLLPLVFGPPSSAQAPPTTVPTGQNSAHPSGCDKRSEQSVVLYDQAGFQGHAKYFGVGGCRLFDSFNDQAASIKVPKGMVAVVYEDADEGGGFGEWVDLLEDQSDLSTYKFEKKISYVEVFPSTRGSFVYTRNGIQGGRFVPGHWEGVRRGGNPVNPSPMVAPPKPQNVATQPPPRPTPRPTPPPPVFCTLNGQVNNYRPIYGSTFKLLLYRSDGSRTQFSTTITGSRYSIPNVPEGTYELRGTGYYRPTNQIITTDGSQRVTCEGGRSNSITFKIGSGEG